MTAQLWVFAGANGAGKSTLVARYVQGRIPVVNPDEIARGLPMREGEASILAAGRIALAQRERHLEAGQTFGLETTLTGRSEVELMRRAKSAGYRVNVAFIGLDTAKLSVSRVSSRVRRGGHNVPLKDLLRRFGRSMDNRASRLQSQIGPTCSTIVGSVSDCCSCGSMVGVKYLSAFLLAWAAQAIPAELRQ